MNTERTLNGLSSGRLTQISLPSTKQAILINGGEGEKGQVLAKNENTNKIEWSFVDKITIPDDSISGDKLKNDIIINTTGSITGSIITATDKFIQTGTNENLFNGQLRLPAITTLNSGDGVTLLNGGNVELFSDTGSIKKIEMDGSNGNITSSGTVFGVALTTSGIITATGSVGFIGVGTDGDSYKTLLNKNGTITCSDGGTKRIELDGGTGDIKTFNASGNETIDIDGATGNINMKLGGHIDLFDGAGNIAIELNGSNGIIECKDINVTAHTGEIVFNEIRTNQLEVPTTGVPDVFLSTNGVSTSAGTAIASGGLLSGHALLISDGTGTTSAVISGDVDATRLIKTTRNGATPPPTDNTYTEWGLDLNTANTHAHIGGNIICDGTIFGNVEGSITEEVVDCQRLNVRDGGIGGDIGVTITGTGATLVFEGSSGNTGIDLDERIIVSKNNLINISGNNGNLTATGNISLATANLVRTVDIGSLGGSQTYTNYCDTIVIGSTTGFGINTTISLNGNTTIKQDNTLLRGNGNTLNGIYKNALSLFDMRGDKISHSLNGTHQKTMCNRSASVREETIPNNRTSAISDTGYLNPTGYGGINVVATSTSVRIHMEAYFLVSTGNPDLYCRIDETISKSNAPYASQTHPHLLTNTAGTSGFNQRKHATILITGLTIGDSYKFYPRFATTSSATCKWVYGGVYGDALISHIFLEDVDISDPIPPPSEDDY